MIETVSYEDVDCTYIFWERVLVYNIKNIQIIYMNRLRLSYSLKQLYYFKYAWNLVHVLIPLSFHYHISDVKIMLLQSLNCFYNLFWLNEKKILAKTIEIPRSHFTIPRLSTQGVMMVNPGVINRCPPKSIVKIVLPIEHHKL